jgi:Rrf2 family cysteine metabolism transcriptional repressor
MFELSRHFNGAPVAVSTIAQSQNISKKYLHNLLTVLRSSGLVKSAWGKKGGFMLSRNPSEITLNEIVAALDGPVRVVECLGDEYCERSGECAVRGVWKEINGAINDILSRTTLQDLIETASVNCGSPSMPEYSI